MQLVKVILFVFMMLSFLEAKELKKVSIQLNWKYQFEFAGFIAAKEKGFYKDIGFDVELKEHENGIDIVKEVEEGNSTFGIYNSSILDHYNSEKPILLLANYFKKSPLVFITKQNIYTPKDLIGKNIMVSSYELENSSLGKLLKKFKIKKNQLNIFPQTWNIEAFKNSEVDAMSSYLSNQTYYLEKEKIPYNIILPDNYEVYGFGGNLFTSLKNVAQNPIAINNFIEATNKGWKYALNNSDEIIDIILKKYSSKKSKKALIYESKKLQNIIMPDIYKLGEIRKTLILDELELSKNKKLIPQNINISDVVFSYSKYSSKYNFTEDELRYLKIKKKIKMCVDPNWMPYERITNGTHVGMISDYIRVFEKELGIPLELHITKKWIESIHAIENRECDILTAAMSTKKREKHMNFTKPYMSFSLALATKKDEVFINNIEKVIQTKKIGIVKENAYFEILRERFPKNKLVLVDSIESGLEKLSQGEIFGLADSIVALGYALQTTYFSELKIGGKFDNKYNLSIAVRSDDDLLFSVFNKVVQKLDKKIEQDILNRWVNIKYDKGFNYSLFWKIIIILFIVVLIIIYRYKEVLRNKNKLQKQQKRLEEKNKELKKAQKALKESVLNFQILFDSTMEGVLIFNEHDCIDINKVGCKLLGYKSKSEVIGKSMYHHVDDDSLVVLQESLNKDLEFYELEFVRTDGTKFPALVKDRYIKHNNQTVKVFTIVDLTELKNRERLLFKQSKLASMGEMIGNIAHQWRQPLSLISTISTGLKLKIETRSDEKEESIEFLDKLNITAQHLSSTIDDFRNFFAADKQKEKFLISSLIEQNLVLLESIFKTNFIEVILEIEKDITLNTYKNELTQALLNILNNANDAFKESKIDERIIFIKIKKKNNCAIISIKDNAGGIPANIITNIFEPYFTTKHKSDGTGIGLYMTYQIIHEHIHGKIEVKNEHFRYANKKQKGANFIITLPLL